MPCDAILLEGAAVVSEAMLTGESVPVIKAPLPDSDEIYNIERDNKHTLYSGTEVLQL